LGAVLSLRPGPFPKPWKSSLRLIASNIVSTFAKMVGQIKEQRCFPHLPWTSEELYPPWSWFLDPLK
jgi:hypothetical protein